MVDEDGLPGDETNYCGGTEEAALEFIANPPADFTKGTPLPASRTLDDKRRVGSQESQEVGQEGFRLGREAMAESSS